jgi:hypothetical protein
MQPRTLLAALAVGLVAAQGAVAYYTNPDYTDPSPSAPTVREQNRAILLQKASTSLYDPTALVTVTHGTAGSLVTVTVQESQALEMELDYLDRHEVNLAETPLATTTSSSLPPSDPEPEWPEDAAWMFWETGWTKSGNGAKCPSVTPIGPVEFKARTGQDWPTSPPGTPLMDGGYQYTAGILRSEVSVHGVQGTSKLSSQLWRWNSTPPDQPDDANPLTAAGQDPYQEYYYGGHYGTPWILEGTGFIDYWCKVNARGDKLEHRSMLEPRMNRVG